jgi:hypothetical protein
MRSASWYRTVIPHADHVQCCLSASAIRPSEKLPTFVSSLCCCDDSHPARAKKARPRAEITSLVRSGAPEHNIEEDRNGTTTYGQSPTQPHGANCYAGKADDSTLQSPLLRPRMGGHGDKLVRTNAQS